MSRKIMADFHLHSDFSGDGEIPMETMIQEGIARGLSLMCFTEHLDWDFPPTPEHTAFDLDIPAYRNRLVELKEKYKDSIDLRFGLELGLQPHLASRHQALLKEWEFDFVIGSSHVTDGCDPYYPAFYEDRTEEEAYTSYFESILDNLKVFNQMDVYGHIDYVVRYGPNKNKFYTYERYEEILEEILRTLISRNVGLEVNTGGFHYGLGHPNPCEEILTRYRQLGGEILTIGSDAHIPGNIAFDFHKLPDLLKSCGFTHYTVFQNRRPQFLPLD